MIQWKVRLLINIQPETIHRIGVNYKNTVIIGTEFDSLFKSFKLVIEWTSTQCVFIQPLNVEKNHCSSLYKQKWSSRLHHKYNKNKIVHILQVIVDK